MKRMGKFAATAAAGVSLVVLTPAESHADFTMLWLRNAHSRKCLEIENSSNENGAQAQQWDCNGQKGMSWQKLYVGPGNTFQIRNAYSGKCLEVENSSTEDGARVQQWSCSGRAGNLWEQVGDGIWNVNSGMALEVENSAEFNGARVQQWSNSPTALGQNWEWM